MDEAENLSSTEDVRPSGEGSEISFSLLHPTKIGRYTILRSLGKGGFGEVFLAFDDDLDRPVAIKVPRPERIAQLEDIEAYLNEARIVASLDHPHIVPVYDVGRTDDGLCFVVSKFIEGSDLAKTIKDARPSFHESAELVATVAEALHYAHTRGLVHRDIKPGNILIDATGKAFVTDFGLALKDEDFGTGARLAGTPAFMSPEQAKGEGHRVDGRSDIFSLGVVLYELLTGRRPFRGDTHLEIMEQIETTEPRPPRQIDDSIPKELERVCLKALMKRASDRYTTAKDMAADLRLIQKEDNDGKNHDVDTECLLPESGPTGSRPAGARLRRIEAKGFLGRLGCWVQLTVVFSMFITLTNILLALQATPRATSSGGPWQQLPAEPNIQGPGGVLFQAYFLVFLCIAVVGVLWYSIRLLVWLVRPVLSVKGPSDEQTL
jgi:serine/threonine protein kinase